MNEGQISCVPCGSRSCVGVLLVQRRAAQAHEGWVLLIYGVIAASNDPAEYYCKRRCKSRPR